MYAWARVRVYDLMPPDRIDSLTELNIMKKAETTSHAREAIPPAAWKPPKQRIVGPLRSRLNQLAHDLAMREETRLRAVLIAQVQDAADQGATAQQLHAMVDVMEAARACA